MNRREQWDRAVQQANELIRREAEMKEPVRNKTSTQNFANILNSGSKRKV